MRAVFLLLVIGGCGQAEQPYCEVYGETPALEIGTGFGEFHTVIEGQELEADYGFQQEPFVLVNLRASGIVPGNPEDLREGCNPTMSFGLYTSEERIDTIRSPVQRGWVIRDDGLYPVTGYKLGFDEVRAPELVGQEFRIEATVTDVSGVSLTQSVWVQSVWAPGSEPDI